MKRFLFSFFLSLFIFLGLSSTQAQEGFVPEEFFKAEVLEAKINREVRQGISIETQEVSVRILEGSEAGKVVSVQPNSGSEIADFQKLSAGEKVIVSKTLSPDGFQYYVVEKYRLPYLGLILLIFFAVIILLSRWKGFFSIIGLILSVFILGAYVVPRIAAGADPLITGLIGALMIALLSMYTAHGFAKRTSIAFASTVITLLISAGMAVLFVNMSKIFGLGSEEAFFLQLDSLGALNLKGLLLAGIIIGALGVLDDITTGQAAAVDEIQKANQSLGFKELYTRGISVGREHISSLVNTLVLAYAGAGLPLFLLFQLNAAKPWWVVLNSEALAEEVVRTLVGSTTLVLAVPITTALAAYFFQKRAEE